MSCPSIVALPRACGAEGVIAGLDKLYIVSFKDMAAVSGSTEVYTVATNGLVNAIGLDSGKHFVEVGLLRSSADVNEKLTKEPSKGVSYFTQTLKVVLSDLTIENQKFIESVLNQPVAILLKTRTGKYYFTGGSGKFELTGVEGGTGTAEADLIGYTLTFDGTDIRLTTQVDDTIVSGLIA